MARANERSDFLPEHMARGDIEAQGGFIEQQHTWPRDECARKFEPPSLAARKTLDRCRRERFESERRHQFVDTLPERTALQSLASRDEAQVVVRAQTRLQCGLLKHDTNSRTDLIRHGDCVETVDENAPAARCG